MLHMTGWSLINKNFLIVFLENNQLQVGSGKPTSCWAAPHHPVIDYFSLVFSSQFIPLLIILF